MENEIETVGVRDWFTGPVGLPVNL
jgi:hypothetical protein